MKIVNRKFKALGFIEVLIAIVVVSTVSAVFFSIATDAMKDLIQMERMESMARLAKNGVNIAQEVANQEKADQISQEEYFPKAFNQCYIPVEDQEANPVYSFAEDQSGTFISYTDGDREGITENLDTQYLWLEDNYFLAMCIEDIEEDNWAYVKFWVGDVKLKGVRTTDSDVKDFIYYAIIKL
jgi:type II secretory pathway pseudopilin PulG